MAAVEDLALRTGLSPRVRGNRSRRRPDRPGSGSIPACAGEPFDLDARALGERVYPRVCGGTCRIFAYRSTVSGLSPRVRGNQIEAWLRVRDERSIPACAGEPTKRMRQRRRCWVYPRVCGGTELITFRSNNAWGLSPRVRGNRFDLRFGLRAEGSIPACAGEPHRSGRHAPPAAVYPRVCGGTSSQSSRLRSWAGLSPRVRGNRVIAHARSPGDGSIPACAGEPPRPGTGWVREKVYPRVCGGTLKKR